MGWLARLARGDGSDGMAVAARRGVAWCGAVWCGAVRCGAVRRGAARCGVERCGGGSDERGWATRREGTDSGGWRARGARTGLGDGWVAAGSITETAGRAAERATKGDENFPPAAKVLSARRHREKSAENCRRDGDPFEFDGEMLCALPHLIRETLFL